MSETVIEPVEFENKSGIKYMLDFRNEDKKWHISIQLELDNRYCLANKDNTKSYYEFYIASFTKQSKAIEFCERLKESE